MSPIMYILGLAVFLLSWLHIFPINLIAPLLCGGAVSMLLFSPQYASTKYSWSNRYRKIFGLLCMGVAAVAMVLALADMVQWSWYFMWAITGWLLMVIEVVLLVAGMLMQHTK